MKTFITGQHCYPTTKKKIKKLRQDCQKQTLKNNLYDLSWLLSQAIFMILI